MTFGLGNSPADDKAEAASRGSEVRILEDASVRGRSGSWDSESGIAALSVARVAERDGGDGGDGLVILEVVRYC